jgi:hypothetical protein
MSSQPDRTTSMRLLSQRDGSHLCLDHPRDFLSTAISKLSAKPGAPFRIPSVDVSEDYPHQLPTQLSFPLLALKRDWQTVSNSAVIAATC